MRATGKVVWSSDPDRRKGSEDQPASDARRDPAGSARQVARLLRERKGRGGKVVTIIEGLRLSTEERDDLARELRKACGAGGTVRGETIEVQGDLRDRLAVLLRARGYQVKLVGG